MILSPYNYRNPQRFIRVINSLRHIFKCILGSLFVLGFILFASETIVRVCSNMPWMQTLLLESRQTTESLAVPDKFIEDSQLIVRLREGHNGFGTDGRRTTTDPKPLDADSRPIVLILGDSMVWGYREPPENSFPFYGQTLLKNFRVLNAGIPGYGPDQEYRYFREYWLPRTESRLHTLVWSLYRNDAKGMVRQCLYVPIGSKLIQVPAWLNGEYATRSLIKVIPNFLRSLVVYDITMYATHRLNPCALVTRNPHMSEQFIRAKLRSLVKNMELLSRESGFRLVLMTAPNPEFLTRDVIDPMSVYTSEIASSMSIPYLNMTGKFEEYVTNPVLRQNILTTLKQNHVSVHSLMYATEFFHSADVEPDSPPEWRHLNASGNKITAALLVRELFKQE